MPRLRPDRDRDGGSRAERGRGGAPGRDDGGGRGPRDGRRGAGHQGRAAGDRRRDRGQQGRSPRRRSRRAAAAGHAVDRRWRVERKPPPVLVTTATTGDGVDKLPQAIESHRSRGALARPGAGPRPQPGAPRAVGCGLAKRGSAAATGTRRSRPWRIARSTRSPPPSSCWTPATGGSPVLRHLDRCLHVPARGRALPRHLVAAEDVELDAPDPLPGPAPRPAPSPPGRVPRWASSISTS